MIDQWVSEYCTCINSATSKSEVDKCEIKGDTTSVKLSEYDKTYLLRKMNRECGKEAHRFDESQPDLTQVDNLLLKGCSYLSEDDLKKFSLKRKFPSFFETMNMIETWEPESESDTQLVLQIIQRRQIVDLPDTLKKGTHNLLTNLVKSDTLNSAISFFDYFAVDDLKDVKGWRYSIVAVKGKLLCSMVILLKEKNPAIIDEFVGILTDKVRNCDF